MIIIFRKIQNYFMNLSTGRDKNTIYRSSNCMPDYNPNFEKNKKKLATCILSF